MVFNQDTAYVILSVDRNVSIAVDVRVHPGDPQTISWYDGVKYCAREIGKLVSDTDDAFEFIDTQGIVYRFEKANVDNFKKIVDRLWTPNPDLIKTDEDVQRYILNVE